MSRFRKKPVEVEAVRWTGDNYAEMEAFAPGARLRHVALTGTLHVDTLEGTMVAKKGDWIIKEPFPTDDRTFYPCKPDIFEATYEPVGLVPEDF